MGGEPLDLWFPAKPRGKGRPLARTIPRNRDVPFIEKEIPDVNDETGFKMVKHYALRHVMPHMYGESTTEFEAAVRRSAQRQAIEQETFKIFTGPVRVDWCAYFPPVNSNTKKIKADKVKGVVPHTHKPDKDNIEKLLCDAINEVAYIDDRQIIFGTGAKIFSHREGLRAIVTPCNPMDVKRWADETFHWPEEEFELEG